MQPENISKHFTFFSFAYFWFLTIKLHTLKSTGRFFCPKADLFSLVAHCAGAGFGAEKNEDAVVLLPRETKTTINTANVQRKRVPIHQIFFSFQTVKAQLMSICTLFLADLVTVLFFALYDNLFLQIFFF